MTDMLMYSWRLPGAFGSESTDEMVKVAFQLVEHHISEQLKEGAISEKDLPPLLLSTRNAEPSCPYKLANIRYPEETRFTVDVDDVSEPPTAGHRNEVSAPSLAECFVDLSRLDALRGIASPSFDLAKLIRFCEELNLCYASECFLAVAVLTRAILDHVPPILGFRTFNEVANNYLGKSPKRSMQHLQESSRSIADSYLHMPIRKKESLPTRVQVNFRNDLDVLLGEIVRVLK